MLLWNSILRATPPCNINIEFSAIAEDFHRLFSPSRTIIRKAPDGPGLSMSPNKEKAAR